MGKVRLRGRDRARTTFWDRNVDPGLTKYVDPRPCLTCQNHGDHNKKFKPPHCSKNKLGI